MSNSCEEFFLPPKIFFGGKKQPIAVTHPHLLKEWDWVENAKLGLNPYKLTAGSGKKANFFCKNNKNHIYNSRIVDVITRGRRCTFCAGKDVVEEESLLALYTELCKEWHPTKNPLGPEKYTPASHKKAWWLCPFCGAEWEAIIKNRSLGGYGCKYCAGREAGYGNDLLTNFPELCEEWDSEKNELGPENYTPGSNCKALWKCKKCDYSWSAVICDRTGVGNGCPNCNKGGSVSKASQKWLDVMRVEQREIIIEGMGSRVDGFDPETNTVYEFLGDFWHGNPEVHKPEDRNPVSKKTFGQLYNQTFTRFEKLKAAGYKIFYVWENNYKKGSLGGFYE